jgi:hypothetical protein
LFKKIRKKKKIHNPTKDLRSKQKRAPTKCEGKEDRGEMKGREERTGDKSDNKLETQPFYGSTFFFLLVVLPDFSGRENLRD